MSPVHPILRDPAARFLPPEELWQPQTWARFRYAVLKQLDDYGAHSVSELCESPPWILFLPIDRDEIRATVDSARRRGLIVPLNPGSVQMANRSEWILTDKGRRTIRHGLPWLMEKVGGIPRSFSAVVALLGSLGLGKLVSQWFRDHDGSDVILVALLLIVVVGFVAAALLSARSRDTGADTRKAVVHDWRRWAHEKPEWYEIATAPFPRRWALAATVYFFASTLAIGLIPGFHQSDFLSIVAFGPIWVIGKPVMEWYNRWGEIETQAAGERKSEAADPALAVASRRKDQTGGTMITKTDFIGVPSTDAERSRAFYVEILGLRPDENSRFECWAGDTCFGIWEPAKQGMEFAPAKNAHPALHVDDVEAARKELEAKGVEFTGETFDTGVCHMALFTDPDGNDLMLHNRYAPYDS